MTSYLRKQQIPKALELIIKGALEECKRAGEMPEDLKQLIMHNFNAKYVHLDCGNSILEIGVKKDDALSLYPKLVTYKFSLDKTKWLQESIRTEENDLEFYGRIIARNKGLDNNTRVVLY